MFCFEFVFLLFNQFFTNRGVYINRSHLDLLCNSADVIVEVSQLSNQYKSSKGFE